MFWIYLTLEGPQRSYQRSCWRQDRLWHLSQRSWNVKRTVPSKIGSTRPKVGLRLKRTNSLRRTGTPLKCSLFSRILGVMIYSVTRRRSAGRNATIAKVTVKMINVNHRPQGRLETSTIPAPRQTSMKGSNKRKSDDPTASIQDSELDSRSLSIRRGKSWSSGEKDLNVIHLFKDQLSEAFNYWKTESPIMRPAMALRLRKASRNGQNVSMYKWSHKYSLHSTLFQSSVYFRLSISRETQMKYRKELLCGYCSFCVMPCHSCTQRWNSLKIGVANTWERRNGNILQCSCWFDP